MSFSFKDGSSILMAVVQFYYPSNTEVHYKHRLTNFYYISLSFEFIVNGCCLNSMNIFLVQIQKFVLNIFKKK